LIFSSLEFLIFWGLAIFVARFKSFNSLPAIGLIGLTFYSFQGYLNFFILFYVYLICALSVFFRQKIHILIFFILLPLITIKYSNFILIDLLHLKIDLKLVNQFEIPPGLSFISFSAIALVLYLRNNSENYKTKLAYLYFFPQLIAGPIVEPKSLIPQLKNKLINSYLEILRGIFIFAVGISIKVLFADNIGQYIDPIFSNLSEHDLNQKMIALFLFSQQIFFDFNGYTLMAIGVGITLGIKLPENFNAPYLSQSISDFWKRWHITLSDWIRNYVYIPMGGSRKGIYQGYLNIFIAMLVSGIWHGAGFNFLIWGSLHGLIIILEKTILNTLLVKIPIFFRILYTYLLVTFLWLFFRLGDLTEIESFFSKAKSETISLSLIYLLIVILFLNFFQKYLTIKFLSIVIEKFNKYFLITFSVIMIFVCIVLSKGSSEKFIYFNF
jgi:alginate O-acetyltransferase complex protein AlgI